MADYDIRDGCGSDVSFILASWLNHYKNSSPMTAAISRDVFFEEHQRVLSYIFKKNRIRVLVACSHEDPDLIFGYLVGEPPDVLHWVYVKPAFRKIGLMTALLSAAGYPKLLENCVITHLTNSAIDLAKARKFRATFNPYDIFGGLDGIAN